MSKKRPDRRPQRRSEAEARQAKYDALSLDEKISRAVSGSQEHTRLLRAKERQEKA